MGKQTARMFGDMESYVANPVNVAARPLLSMQRLLNGNTDRAESPINFYQRTVTTEKVTIIWKQ